MVGKLFVGINSSKPSRDFTRPLGSQFWQTHTHALSELSCLFEFSMTRKNICAN